MNSTIQLVKDRLVDKGLKVTPQRIAILGAIYSLNNHPTVEMIMEYIQDSYPNIASGTVYKVLGVLVDNQVIKRVKTEEDVMRYDGITENHHHLYCSESGQIEDYTDNELDQVLAEYFVNKGINNFQIEEIRLHINGKFLKQGEK